MLKQNRYYLLNQHPKITKKQVLDFIPCFALCTSMNNSLVLSYVLGLQVVWCPPRWQKPVGPWQVTPPSVRTTPLPACTTSLTSMSTQLVSELLMTRRRLVTNKNYSSLYKFFLYIFVIDDQYLKEQGERMSIQTYLKKK